MRHRKKTGPARAFLAIVRRIFRARNVIIISDHKVEHVPLSGTMQVLLLLATVGLFSGVSYITGSYMTARTAIHERDQKIVSSTIERSRIGEEMDILKRDLIKLSQNGKELSAYSRFIVGQPNESTPAADRAALAAVLPSDSLFGQSNKKLLDRIADLETRMREARDENEHLVTAIRERTDKKLAYFEDIIAMTGLNSEHLARVAQPAASRADRVLSSLLPSRLPLKSEILKSVSGGTENQGGPYIPYDPALTDTDHELLAGVDRLVLLHDIVEQLPLSQPIGGAKVTGPFGQRIDPLNGRWAIHPGIDLAGPAGSHIFSASAGKVVAAEHRAAYGNMVDIDHGFGIVTRYGHLSRILVHDGEKVRKGQLIGVQGSTGRSTGPHLHYEVRINDHPVNPAKFLHAGEYVLQN